MAKGLYVHVPFCREKCPYCDFFSLTVEYELSSYLSLLTKEAELRRKEGEKLTTLYLGGGTPSLLSPSQVERLAEELSRLFDLSSLEEFTLEVNPEDYDLKDFKALKAAGVNRVSVGVQSFTEKGLKALGRRHSPEKALRAVEYALEAGIEKVSVDLIWGWQGQREEDLLKELRVLERLPLGHASWYLLTLYEGTPMGKNPPSLPSEEELERLHRLISEGMRALGFERYEVSNWARGGEVSLHNLLYWKMEPFLGLGAGAWGFTGRERYANPRNLKLYEERLKEGREPTERRIPLDSFEREKEFIILSLRLREGLPPQYSAFVPERLKEFFEEDRVAVKEEYLLLLNEITAEFLLEWERKREYNILLEGP